MQLTVRYSTSFSASSRLFARRIRTSIYAIYGMVRLADEIVDTYLGADALTQLDDFAKEVYAACNTGYSTNPIVHAFADTARRYDIDRSLIEPFFASMHMDLGPARMTRARYERYIYGSAEVVGLMCLKVFTEGDGSLYRRLHEGARALGAAYQKVNFLRDMKADYEQLGRVYFPGVSYNSFDDGAKAAIVKDIRQDLMRADEVISHLPATSQRAVKLSRRYYGALLERLDKASSDELLKSRVRISDARKLWWYLRARLRLL